MATVDNQGIVSAYDRDADGRTWSPAGSFQPDHPPIKAAWIPPRYGSTLAIASSDGSIELWVHKPSSKSPWILTSSFKHTSLPILDLAPAVDDDFDHPLIAACCADGHLRMYAPTAPGDTWELLYDVLVTAPGSGGACTSASWCQHHNNKYTPTSSTTTSLPSTAQAAVSLPPMLVIGTATEGASIWMLQESIMKWKKVADLIPSNCTSSNKVAAVDWAPRLGRRHELIAVACDSTKVVLWSIKDRSDAPHIDQVAVLDHESPVWQVKWNMFGNWLATSCDNGEVHMWRPDFSGEWLLLNKVVAGGEGDVLM